MHLLRSVTVVELAAHIVEIDATLVSLQITEFLGGTAKRSLNKRFGRN